MGVAFNLKLYFCINAGAMKRRFGFFLVSLFLCLGLGVLKSNAQCSICTRTTQQMGERPGKAFNAGILYLAFTPLAIGGILGYRWYKQNR
jgi:hypothetical protein